MRRQSNVYGLLAAAAALGLWGCTDLPLPTPDGCTSDSSCATTEMCHPVLKKCVTSCTAGADCPQEAKTCAPLASSAKSFCQCATDPLCANATANNICMEATKQCSPKCTGASSCPSGYDCATATGQCVKSTTDAGTPDAGTPDAGTGGTACTYRSCTGDKESCNLTTNRCQVATCNSANAQPDTCGYARFCASDDGCYDTEAPTCTNFTAGSFGGLSFNPVTSTGPIIYQVEHVTNLTQYCTPSQVTLTYRVSAYRTDADWPAQKDNITTSFRYVNPDGSSGSALAVAWTSSGYTPSGRTATFVVTICPSAGTTYRTTGFVFGNGNEICAASALATPGTG